MEPYSGLMEGMTMPKTNREYISKHIYKTPSGQYWDDRTGKRRTAKRGEASAASVQRMKARVRDETGKLTFKRISVNTDIRKKGTKHTGSPDNEDVEADTVYDPMINEALASQYVERRLDTEQPDYDHFNISFTGEVEA